MSDTVHLPTEHAATCIGSRACASADGHPPLTLTVTAEAPGLCAALPVETFDGDGLAGYVRSLDQSFRGWKGERTWRSHRADLRIRAAHPGRAVRLVRELRFAGPAEDDQWAVTVPVFLTPGEELRRAALDVAALIETARPV